MKEEMRENKRRKKGIETKKGNNKKRERERSERNENHENMK
jgi:hypothetical protein